MSIPSLLGQSKSKIRDHFNSLKTRINFIWLWLLRVKKTQKANKQYTVRIKATWITLGLCSRMEVSVLCKLKAKTHYKPSKPELKPNKKESQYQSFMIFN